MNCRVFGSMTLLLFFAAAGCSRATPVAPANAAVNRANGAAAVPLQSQRVPGPRDAARFEIQFLTMMIDHHGSAVQMTSLCPGRTIHDELTKLCQDMHDAQQREIATMQQWLKDWYGVTHEPELDSKGRRMIDGLAQLKGKQFETAFMRSLIPHHLKAIMMSEEAVRRARHPELVKMAQDMIHAQRGEVRTMRGWLCSWYADCREGREGR